MLDERASLAAGGRRVAVTEWGIRLRRHGLWVALAMAGFWLAFDGGTYSLRARNTVAIVVWWAISLGILLGVWRLARVTAAAWGAGALLLFLTVLTAASAAWGTGELAVSEMSRTLLYGGVFTLVFLVVATLDVGGWVEGLAVALVAVCVVGLASRFLPNVVSGDRELAHLLPSTLARLSYPVGYWNGLGILAALAVPLLAAIAAADAQPRAARAAAVAALPIVAETIYLTSSRGAAAVAVVGALVALGTSSRRWPQAGALALGVFGSLVAVLALAHWTALVNHPGSKAATRQGHIAALVTVAVCLVTAALFVVLVRRLPAPVLSLRARRVLLLAVAAAIVAGIVAVHPVARFDSFRRAPAVVGQTAVDRNAANPLQAHLLSSGSTGRWQQWTAALHEFTAHPLVGGGAGSFAAWWAQHGTLPGYIADAHSLYFETLGELGIVGFLLVVAFVLVGLALGFRRTLRATDRRQRDAALLGVFAAWCVGAGIDWMWELPAVTIVAMVALGVVLGTPHARDGDLAPEVVPAARMRKRFAAALVAAGTVALAAETVPLLAQIRIDSSQAAVRAGDLTAAVAEAQAARRIEPWAATPYTQLALLEEQQRNYPRAIVWMNNALDRDSHDWRLWLTRARLRVESGDVGGARRDLDRAKELNPRSLLFAGR